MSVDAVQRRARGLAALSLTVASAVVLCATPPATDLADVLRRAGEAVVRHGRESSVLIADESCQQRAYKDNGASHIRTLLGQVSETNLTARRRWKAELATVPILLHDISQPGVPWLEIRDVLEVDGQPLPGREARLERLVRADMSGRTSQIRDIAEESARFNIGPVRRTMNQPSVPLIVLWPPNQPRFAFRKLGEAKPKGVTTWRVGFQEVQSPTLIRAADTGADMAAAGTLWIEEASGEVVRAELQCGADAESRLEVTYQRHPRLGLRVPAEMVEKMTANRIEWVDGTCSYSNYRRFETSGRLVLPGK